MTKNQVMEKIEEMIANDVIELKSWCDNLLNNGGINIKRYNDNYRLPKIILHAAIQKLESERRPLCSDDRKESKNLSYFL